MNRASADDRFGQLGGQQLKTEAEERARQGIRAYLIGLELDVRRGLGDVETAFRLVSADLIEQERPLPGHIRQFLVAFLRRGELPKRSKGGRRSPGRDLQIAGAVAIAMDAGLSFTRNPFAAHARHSACSLVAEVVGELTNYHLGEAAIEKVCRSFASPHVPWAKRSREVGK